MGDIKKGKKKSASSTADAADDSLKPSELQLKDDVTIEVYESKVRYLTEKLARVQHKCDALVSENQLLGDNQAKFSQDRKDIVEFLNIKVQEHEKQINTLEHHVVTVEAEKTEMEGRINKKFENSLLECNNEIENLHMQCVKYKTDLDQLSEFKGKKDDMEFQIFFTKQNLESREKEYKEIIHTMERKILQDKNLMKKEMLQKVNEAVANFRRVADQQMAETTKRAIRENMAITAQLKKMSTKTMDLIAENESLLGRVSKLKITNSLLVESEKDLAKKNHANQMVVKMLVEKLKESDKILEFAYEHGVLQDIQDEVGSVDVFSNNQSNDEDLKAQINSLKESNHAMQNKIISFKKVSREVAELFSSISSRVEENESKIEIVNVLPLSLMKDLSKILINSDILGKEDEECTSDQILFDMNQFSFSSKEAQPQKLSNEVKPLPQIQSERSSETLIAAIADVKVTNHVEKRRAPPTLMNVIVHIPSTKKALEADEASKSLDDGFYGSDTMDNRDVLNIQHHKFRSVGVQTIPSKFAPHQVKAEQLLTELRPWGPPAHCIPKKGSGLYCPKSHKAHLLHSSQYYIPPTSVRSKNESEISLFQKTPSTTIMFNSTTSF